MVYFDKNLTVFKKAQSKSSVKWMTIKLIAELIWDVTSPGSLCYHGYIINLVKLKTDKKCQNCDESCGSIIKNLARMKALIIVSH